MSEKRFQVLVGNYGSGKTELAIHFANEYAANGGSVTLVDLDIINPYFRASEKALALKAAGVELITPRYALDDVEIITIDPRIYSAFVDNGGLAVFDVGGDNIGARAMGQYWSYFSKLPAERLDVWLVINVHRPLSGSLERILAQREAIEDAARLKVTGLINNSNMSYETTGEDIAAGYELVRQVSEHTSLPVAYTSGQQEPLDGFLALAQQRGYEQRFIGRILPFAPMIHRNLDSFAKYGL